MADIKLLLALLATVAVTAAEITSQARAKSDLLLLRLRVEILREKLEEKCPQVLSTDPWIEKRQTVSDSTATYDIRTQVEAELYNRLLKLYITCQGQSTNTSMPDATTTHLPATTTHLPATTTYPTTTNLPPTQPCNSTNTKTLTESWRNSYQNTDLRNFESHEVRYGKAWFRLAGEAGNKVKNTCPTKYSCGSSSAYWSDDQLPTSVGQAFNFTMYESLSHDRSSQCKAGRHQAMVIRCSHDAGDFVYKFNARMSGGPDTVCGMDSGI